MAGNVQTLAPGISDGAQVPAVTKISPNQRVSTTTGTIGTVADVVQFAGAPPTFTVVGNWISPNSRTMAMGLPTIAQSSIGACFNAVGVPTSPMTVKFGDPRVSAQ
jgi:hypothetical protein